MMFNIEINDMAFVSIDQRPYTNVGDDENKFISGEIVKYETDNKVKKSQFTLARWNRNKDDEFSLEFVGDRPFHEDLRTFMTLAAAGQELLTKLITTPYDKVNF